MLKMELPVQYALGTNILTLVRVSSCRGMGDAFSSMIGREAIFFVSLALWVYSEPRPNNRGEVSLR